MRHLKTSVQNERARLISPYFDYLRIDPEFRKGVESIRKEYGISDPEGKTFKIPLFLLNQEYWNPDFETMRTVNGYGEDMKDEWRVFHSKIEVLAAEFRIARFPNLVKEYVLTGRFGNALQVYGLELGGDFWTATGHRSIKREYFDEIWERLQEYNKANPMDGIQMRYSDEILQKYESIKKIKRRHQGFPGPVVALIRGKLGKDLDAKSEHDLQRIDKSDKSRLKAQIDELFSLLEILENAT